jgi:hypothetical protein
VAAAGQRCGLHLESYGLWYFSSLPMRFEASSHLSIVPCMCILWCAVWLCC